MPFGMRAAEGDYGNAALNAAACIPVAGQAAKMAKAGVEAFELTTKGSSAAFKLSSTAMQEGKGAIQAVSVASKGTGKTASKIEANAARQLAEMESETPNAHYFSRHGAGTTLDQQFTRATNGLTPNGVAGRAVDSSRFLNNQIQFNAAQRAQTIFRQTGKTSFSFNMGVTVGEGYLRGGSDLLRTTNVLAVFRNGELYTMYPLLKQLPY